MPHVFNMSLDLLLVNPNRIRPAVAPLAIEYLAEAAQDAGLRVQFLDLCFADDPQGALRQALGETEPRLVGMTFRNTDDCYMATQHSFVPELAELVSTVRQHSGAGVVLGGAGFSAAPQGILKHTAADWGIVGDGEVALVALARALRDGTSWATIPGLAWRSLDAFHANPPAWPDFGQQALRRETVDNARYFREGGQGSLETKRGCDRRCTYCADPLGKGTRLRLRPPAAVAEEARRLLAQGVDVLHLCDAEFNLPRSHAQAVCEQFIRRGLGERLRWYAYLCPVPFDAELAHAMRRAGCVGINFGTDHADSRMLAALGRSHTSDDIRRMVRACRDAGIAVMVDLLLGAPGETLQTVERCLRFMQEVEPTCVGVAVGVRVYPGTRLARSLQEGPRAGVTHSHGPPDDLSLPVFYLEPAIADQIMPHIRNLVADDPRFFVAGPAEGLTDYNYDGNPVLVKAIAAGERGAYWDILRRSLGLE